MSRFPVSKIAAATASAALAISVFTSCSKSSDTAAAASGTTTLSEFAASLAEDMVLSSPTAQRSTTMLAASRIPPNYKQDNGVIVMDAPAAEDSAAEKQDALEVLLADTAPTTCAIALTLQNAGRATCYGPSVNYTNHEFNASSGSWPGGDLGIWETTEASGEACVAAQLNGQMKGAVSLVDMAQFIGAGMSCVANKNSLTFPAAAGDSLDLSSSMSGVVTIDSTALTVTSATISRAADDGSNPVYITSLVGTAGSKTITIRIKHISTTADDSTNKGKISVKVSNTSPNGTDGVSLEYEKTSSTVGTMLLKKINFNAAGQDPFVSASNYTVDYAKSWNNSADYLLAQFNPTDYTGKFAFAWQAGNGDSNTRVFNAIITESGGTVSGSGFFGFGPTVQTGAGSITGMICAWTGPDQTHTPVSKVQRQDFTMTAGTFLPTGTSNTVFDPVADCEAAGTMAMSWNSGASTRTVSSTTENLSAIGEVTTVIGTLPTAPTAVD